MFPYLDKLYRGGMNGLSCVPGWEKGNARLTHEALSLFCADCNLITLDWSFKKPSLVTSDKGHIPLKVLTYSPKVSDDFSLHHKYETISGG